MNFDQHHSFKCDGESTVAFTCQQRSLLQPHREPVEAIDSVKYSVKLQPKANVIVICSASLLCYFDHDFKWLCATLAHPLKVFVWVDVLMSRQAQIILNICTETAVTSLLLHCLFVLLWDKLTNQSSLLFLSIVWWLWTQWYNCCRLLSQRALSLYDHLHNVVRITIWPFSDKNKHFLWTYFDSLRDYSLRVIDSQGEKYQCHNGDIDFRKWTYLWCLKHIQINTLKKQKWLCYVPFWTRMDELSWRRRQNSVCSLWGRQQRSTCDLCGTMNTVMSLSHIIL